MPAALGLTSTSSLSVAVYVLSGALFLAFVVWVIGFKLRRPSDSGTDGDVAIGIQKLKSLEKKGMLTPEEAKRVREAAARQFLDRQREEERRAELAKMSPLQWLAVEAERVDEQLESSEREASADFAAPLPDTSPSHIVDLSPRLRALADRTEAELEALLLAGFISQADMDEIHRVLGER